MKPPTGMSPAGRAAFRRAVAAHGDGAEQFTEAIVRFAWAVHREDACLREWLRLGQPLTLVQTNGVEGMHPLVRELAVAQRDAAKLGANLRLDALTAIKRVSGRPVGAASAPDRLPAAPAKLRSVK